MTIKAKKSKINLREKLAELLNFRQIRDRLDGLGLYLGKDRTGTAENLAVRGGANVDDLQLAEISAAVGGTAVDVFVYDTRNDSDGGKWRERTQNTSWYNEELNTATRGSRREFPAVAVIVAEAGKVTIYDGDDPDLNMWMVFNQINYNGSSNTSCVAFLNGILVFGRNVGFPVWNFIKDREGIRTDSSLIYQTNVSLRNEASNGSILTTAGSPSIINNNINDVAMTVLPNAPIDSETGLPIPTIAVATDGGVSVIKDDGSVVDITAGTDSFTQVSFTKDNDIVTSNQNITWAIGGMPSGDIAYSSWKRFESYGIDYTGPNGDFNFLGTHGGVPGSLTSISQKNIGADLGLTLIEEDIQNKDLSSICYVSSSYNTGWMPGDIKLATLSDTKIETVGVDETTELVTNGGFGNDDTSGWSLSGSPTIAFSTSGVIDVTGDGEGLYQDIAPGTYLVSVGTISGTGGEVRFTDMDSLTQLFAASQSGDSLVITSSGNLRVYIRASGNNLASFDNISVKQTGELITNGTFDGGTTGWTSYKNAVLTYESSDYIKVAQGEAYCAATQSFSTIPGRKYIVSATLIDSGNPTQSYLEATTDPAQNGHAQYATNNGETIVITYTALSTTSYVKLAVGTTSYSTWDNISVRLAEDDRSVNDNGLQVFGEITKSPVAPGADLVAYSGFSADNYLMQPYNSDLDFGTGDFSIIGWVNKNSTKTQIVLSSGDDVISLLYIYISSANELRFAAGGVGTNAYGSIGSDSVWNQITIVRKDGVVYGYINGVFQASYSNPDAVTHSSNDMLKIGSSVSGLYPFGGSLSLIRLTATSITPDQIAKIYRDEKVLFQDGAQATLYGTSDAVTALAYDDKTELLHVGTSSGRSDFAGLRRINNTTTAVTTSISASNNLIAEQ